MPENAILPKQDKQLFEFFNELYEKFVRPVEEGLTEQITVEDSQLATLAEYVSESCAIEQRDRLARFMEQLESEEELHRKRAQAEERKARLAKRIRETMAGALVNIMGNSNVRRFNGETYSFTRAKNPAGVEIFDEAAIPRETCATCGTVHGQFWTVTSTVSAQRINDAIQSKQDVPGARLKDDKFHLLIR